MRIKSAHIALILSILAMAVSLFTAVQVSRNDNAALIDALMAQNQQLQAQVDALAGQSPDAPGQTNPLSGVTLTAVGWADGSGADVILTLDPEQAPEGDVLLRVTLGSAVITEAPCFFDGSVLTASAAVPAENGYTYTLVIGSEARTLASAENPAYPELVYLADSLSAYCNLVVGEWFIKDDMLTLQSCYAHVHTSQLSGSAEAYTQVRIALKHGDEVLAEEAISPVEEGSGSFACAVSDVVFALPDLPEGDQVDLWLEASLPSGQVLTHCAATWYAMHGGFSMAAG